MTVQILRGGALEMLKTLPDQSVHMCVTSPPYFGLRDYGVDGQIGLEASPQEFIARLVEVFHEVKRVLRDDGTCWVNISDSYAGSGRGGNTGNGTSTIGGAQRDNCPTVRGSRLPAGMHAGQVDAGALGRAWVPPPAGLKNKDLIGVPWMLAFALRADGWYLRQEIIWAKANPMPESVGDRCTKSHESIFLLSKSASYFYDSKAIAEPVTQSTVARLAQDVDSQEGSARVPGKTNGMMKAKPPRFGGQKYGDDTAEMHRTKSGNDYTGSASGLRNKRSVWNINTKPFSEAHFATFPPELPEICIKAGCPGGGLVLDPFFGAGTTGLVADRLGRDCIGIELNPDYAAMARRRIQGDAPLLVEVAA